MIEEIVLENIATFREKVIIGNLSKINFIYGANGTGKTTISNFLVEETICNDCNIKWQNEPIEILVYNKKFKDENFYTDNLKGIYTFGQASKESLEKIEELKKELSDIEKLDKKEKTSKETLEKDLQDLEDELKKFIWERLYKDLKKDFKNIYRGKIGSGDKFKDFILSFKVNKVNGLDFNKTIDELKNEYNMLFDSNITILEKINFNIDTEQIVNIENNPIFTKKIIGKDDIEISKLINRLNIADWVYQGKKYLEDSNICPFCQQPTITDDFKKQLEEYFDEEYKNNITLLKHLKDSYYNLTQEFINKLNEKIQIIKNNKFYNSYIDFKKLENFLTIITDKFNLNYQKIDEKLKEPSRKIELENNKSLLLEIVNIFNNLNQKVNEHNQKVEQLSEQKEKLEKDFFSLLILKYKDDIDKQVKKINGIKKGLDKINQKIQDLEKKSTQVNNEIKSLNSELTNIETAVNKINTLLDKFGFQSFKLKVKDDKFYEIKRENGEIAKDTLSEGETTFITFLYFLQLIEGSFDKENVQSNKILVIDDPISSLDSQILFIVSTLIKEYIQKVRNEDDYFIKQIIILTHNVYFHKEISFTSQREQNNIRNDTSYYILRKYNNVSFITFYKNNPINSSYELLWIDLSTAIKSENPCKSTIQNTMRKILENYFKVFGGIKEDEIISKFENTEEQYICKSLISWINEGSHSIPDDFEVQIQDSEIEKYINVFEMIFNRMGHKAHYEMMMNIKK